MRIIGSFLVSLVLLQSQAWSAPDFQIRAISVPAAAGGSSISGNGFSAGATMTPDGRYVAFVSEATDLTAEQTLPMDRLARCLNVFVRDREAKRTLLVSVSSQESRGGNGNSFDPEPSADGRFVVFTSKAEDLVDNDTNAVEDVFVRDLLTATTALVSVNWDGAASGNGGSQSASITPDGRYVVFESAASDLVAGDTNGITDIFLRDLQEKRTILVSVNAVAPGNMSAASVGACISTNGQRVAFVSTATNLVADVAGVWGEIYVRDVAAGTTYWASKALAPLTPGEGRTESTCPSISADGQYVVFHAYRPGLSGSTNIARFGIETAKVDLIATDAAWSDGVAAAAGPAVSSDGRFVVYERSHGWIESALYRWDSVTGESDLVSVRHDAEERASGMSQAPAVSPDGRYVAFVSSGTNLVTNLVSGDGQVYLRDMDRGVTQLISSQDQVHGVQTIAWEAPVLSADGQTLAFTTAASQLVSFDLNDAEDVFVRDRAQADTELISCRGFEPKATTANGRSTLSPGALSADGHFLVFTSYANDISAGDTNGFADVFVSDLSAWTTRRLSVSTNFAAANSQSCSPVISADGRVAAFVSLATNLTPGDTNSLPDLYAVDLETGNTALVSYTLPNHLAAGIETLEPVRISADGKVLLFASGGGRIMSSLQYSVGLFWRRWMSGETYEIGDGRRGGFSLSQDARTVTYLQSFDICVKWSLSEPEDAPGETHYISAAGSWLSSDGAFLCYHSRPSKGATPLYRAQPGSATGQFVGLISPSATRPWVATSIDNRWIAYVSSAEPLMSEDTNGCADLVFVDQTTQEATVVSMNRTGTATANGVSDSPSMSADGRFIAFRSFAADLVANDTNAHADIYLYDRETRETTLVSRRIPGASGGDASCSNPQISANGATVAFHSHAADLVPGDRNSEADVFVVKLDTRDDSDDDGLDDAWERQFFGGLDLGPDDDPDADGARNLDESRAGTDPTLASSLFRITSAVQSSDGRATLRWNTSPGRTYQVQSKDDLSTGEWSVLWTWQGATEPSVQFTDPQPQLTGRRFYRVLLAE